MPASPISDFKGVYAEYTFSGKRPDENIILLMRKHWLILVYKLIPVLLALLMIWGFHWAGPGILATVFNLESAFFTLVESFLWMFLWVILFVTWVDYYLDVWIITDQRIIDIEQLGFFRRQISELSHEKIQDVTSEVQGVIPTLFNFGFVYVQTAGEKERFIFKQVHDPVRVRNIIMELQKWAILQEKKQEGEIFRGKL